MWDFTILTPPKEFRWQQPPAHACQVYVYVCIYHVTEKIIPIKNVQYKKKDLTISAAQSSFRGGHLLHMVFTFSCESM